MKCAEMVQRCVGQVIKSKNNSKVECQMCGTKYELEYAYKDVYCYALILSFLQKNVSS